MNSSSCSLICFLDYVRKIPKVVLRFIVSKITERTDNHFSSLFSIGTKLESYVNITKMYKGD